MNATSPIEPSDMSSNLTTPNLLSALRIPPVPFLLLLARRGEARLCLICRALQGWPEHKEGAAAEDGAWLWKEPIACVARAGHFAASTDAN